MKQIFSRNSPSGALLAMRLHGAAGQSCLVRFAELDSCEKLESWVVIHNFLMLFTVLYGNFTTITVIHPGAFC